jgi:hypothetical protein
MTATAANAWPVCERCGWPTTVQTLIGYEAPGVYDGVLLWIHTTCGHKWPRFAAPNPLHDAARRIIDAWGDES